jgi:hypothetical protein
MKREVPVLASGFCTEEKCSPQSTAYVWSTHFCFATAPSALSSLRHVAWWCVALIHQPPLGHHVESPWVSFQPDHQWSILCGF